MNDLLSDSFVIPQDQNNRNADIEMGMQRPNNSEDLGLENFFKQVQEVEKQYEKLNTLLRKLQPYEFISDMILEASKKTWNPRRIKRFKEALHGVMKQYQEENSSLISKVVEVGWHEGVHKNVVQVQVEELGVKADHMEKRGKMHKKIDSATRAAAATSYRRCASYHEVRKRDSATRAAAARSYRTCASDHPQIFKAEQTAQLQHNPTAPARSGHQIFGNYYLLRFG